MTMMLPDLDTEYRQIYSLTLHDDEINVIGFSGILRAYSTDFSEACPERFRITNNRMIIEQFEGLQTCKARILALAVPLDLVIVGDGEYCGKTIKDLPSWLYDDLVGISTG